MFIDEARIYCRSGRGGAGVVHFRREKYVPRGGPDGGDGGRGGDVVFQVNEKMNTLLNFRYKHKFIAEDGKIGRGSNMSGRGAPNLVIPVPPGTMVYNAETNALLGDLVEPGQELTVCKGGRGGRGNQHFATSRNQAPRTAEKGEPPEECEIRLELKLLADIGIVGVPNAGKSSLLAAVTNARPKIADYPFTTVEPNLGVVRLDTETDLILADIPGLIEGAHEGVGLGDAFLKHIQRTRVLIHVLDGSAEDPMADFSQTNQELALFDADLGEKPQVVVVNKVDLPGVREAAEKLLKKLTKMGYETYAISALTRENLTPVLWKAHEILLNTPKKEVVPELPVYKPAEDPRDFTIEREGGGWRVRSAAIERAAEMTYWEHHGSVRRFQHLMVSLGVDAALRERGINNGDTVYVLDYELEWQD